MIGGAMIDETDNELISQYLHGDKHSFDILVERYLKLVFSLALHYTKNAADAEDVAQETFVRLWKNLKKFDRQKNFKPWLCRITINACLDFLRKKKTVPFSQFDNADTENLLEQIISDPAASASEALITRETEQMLASAVHRLPATDQEIVSLHHNEDLSFREIASRLSAPLNTVKSRYRRALFFLRKLITKQS